MIDLEALEKQIDALLEKETAESLTSWFISHRVMVVPNILLKSGGLLQQSPKETVVRISNEVCSAQKSYAIAA